MGMPSAHDLIQISYLTGNGTDKPFLKYEASPFARYAYPPHPTVYPLRLGRYVEDPALIDVPERKRC